MNCELMLGPGKLPFQAAEDSCVVLGGHLASNHSDGDHIQVLHSKMI